MRWCTTPSLNSTLGVSNPRQATPVVPELPAHAGRSGRYFRADHCCVVLSCLVSTLAAAWHLYFAAFRRLNGPANPVYSGRVCALVLSLPCTVHADFCRASFLSFRVAGSALPEQFLDVPYAPFGKSDRIGRAADFTAPVYFQNRSFRKSVGRAFYFTCALFYFT